MPEKKPKIQENIDRQAKEWHEKHPDGIKNDFAEWFENWESHIKTGHFKKKAEEEYR